jgi:hypothetical protein
VDRKCRAAAQSRPVKPVKRRYPTACGPITARPLLLHTSSSAISGDPHRDDAFAWPTLSSGEVLCCCSVGGLSTSPWSSAAQSLPRQQATAPATGIAKVSTSGSLHLLALAFRNLTIPRAGDPGTHQTLGSRSQPYSTPSFNFLRRVDSETDALCMTSSAFRRHVSSRTIQPSFFNVDSYGSRTLSSTSDAHDVRG